MTLADELTARIDRHGPLTVADYVEACLYDPHRGFYTSGGRAGRRGDFLTAPEVGPLFGAVLARALDAWWDELGRPDPFVVTDWGAGPGTLARALVAADPACAAALELHLVEVSADQKTTWPAGVLDGPAPSHVVVANELLDNVPFDVAEWDGRVWHRVRIGTGPAGGFQAAACEEITVRGVHGDPGTLDPGARIPVQERARRWIADTLELLVPGGRLVVFDYGAPTLELARRGTWLRTHRRHESADWLADPGSCDITADVAVDQIQADHRADWVTTQADFLERYGLAELVAEGRRIWAERAAVGDLAALRARSRIAEAAALTDPAGMGSFVVLEWCSPSRRR